MSPIVLLLCVFSTCASLDRMPRHNGSMDYVLLSRMNGFTHIYSGFLRQHDFLVTVGSYVEIYRNQTHPNEHGMIIIYPHGYLKNTIDAITNSVSKSVYSSLRVIWRLMHRGIYYDRVVFTQHNDKTTISFEINTYLFGPRKTSLYELSNSLSWGEFGLLIEKIPRWCFN